MGCTLCRNGYSHADFCFAFVFLNSTHSPLLPPRMWPDSKLLGALSLRCLKQCRPTLLQKRCAHYQITSTGEKVVVSKKHNIRSKREKWQNVSPMGKEPEVTKINLIEKNARLHSDPKQAKLMAESKLTQLRSRLLISGYVCRLCWKRLIYRFCIVQQFLSRWQTIQSTERCQRKNRQDKQRDTWR